MISLVAGTAFFVGIHLFVAGTTLRDRITDRIGEKGYLGAFSLASLVGIVWMCSAYAGAPLIDLWGDRAVPRWIAELVMPVAFVLAVVGLTTPSPTAAGGEALLESGDAVRGILRITRHPFLVGVVLWAAVHLLANGDAASLVFFGGLLVMGAAGPASIDAKRARKLGAAWQGFASATSIVPFAAIAAGRNRFVASEIGLWRIAAGVVMWGVMWYAHDWLFG